MDKKSLMAKKEKALNYFVMKLLKSKVRNYIGKIILFGSMIKGHLKEDSDIDLLILATDKLDEVSEVSAEASLWAGIEMKEGVEPLIYCIDQIRHPHSYFIYKAIKDGKEVYKMDEKTLLREEVRGYLDLAKDYLEIAEYNLDGKKTRGVVDAAYNAAELSAKGLILLKLKDVPTSHGGIVRKLSELYIKPVLIPEKISRRLNRALERRGKARYDFHANISQQDALEVIELARELMKILEDKIET